MSMYESRRFTIIENLLPNSSGKQYALDLGCGHGRYTKLLIRKGYEAMGIDLNKANLRSVQKQATENPDFLCMDCSNLGFKENQFDIILALEVIEHLETPRRLLEEIRRVAKPDAHILISTPNWMSIAGAVGKLKEFLTGDRWNAWDRTHKRIHSSIDFICLLKSYFEIRKVIGYFYSPKAIDHRYRLTSFFGHMSFTKPPANVLGFNELILCRNPKSEPNFLPK